MLVRATAPERGVPGKGGRVTDSGGEGPRSALLGQVRAAAAAGRLDEALDLGSTVLPVLLRSYGPKVGAGLVVLLLVWWASRRRG